MRSGLIRFIAVCIFIGCLSLSIFTNPLYAADPPGGKSIFDLDGKPVDPTPGTAGSRLATRPSDPVGTRPIGSERPLIIRPPATGQPMAVPGFDSLAHAELALKSSIHPYPPQSAADRQALATKLLQRGVESNDPAEKFVCLRECRQLAAAAGDIATAIRALSETSKAFMIAGLGAKLDLLAKVDAATLSAGDAKTLSRFSMEVGAEAIAADDFDQAEKALGVATIAAKSSGDAALIDTAAARAGDIASLREEAARIKPHEQKLAADPSDPVANFAVGRFRCFRKGDWRSGLPLLAKGFNKLLKTLAEDELAAPATPQKQFDLANRWYDQAKLQPSAAQPVVYSHASTWYAAALPGLAGADKTTATERIAQYPPPAVAPKVNGAASKVAKEFWFNDGGVPGNPATRIWSQTGENSWEERYPDGRISRFKVFGPSAEADHPGLIVTKLNEVPVEVVIPPGIDGAMIYFRFTGQGQSAWIPLGRIHVGPLPR